MMSSILYYAQDLQLFSSTFEIISPIFMFLLK